MKKLTKKESEKRKKISEKVDLLFKILINIMILYLAIELFIIKDIFGSLVRILLVYYNQFTAVLFTLFVAYGFYKVFMWLIGFTDRLFTKMTKTEEKIHNLKKEYLKTDKEKRKELKKEIELLELKEKISKVKND